MTSIEIIIALGIATYGGVELVKHLVPDYYHRETNQIKSMAHERLDALEAKIEELAAKAKGTKK